MKTKEVRKKEARAWSVHLFTASGAACGFLALIAIMEHQWQLAFVWMIISVAIDSFDGLLARKAQVKGVLPSFDGALLDNVIDYFTYVIVPAFFMYEADLLPPLVQLALPLMIIIASAYQFCQNDAKTDDHFFKGFPSYWNVLIFYLFMLGLEPTVNAVLIGLCTVLVFVPIKYIYPSRTEQFQKLTWGLGFAWAISNLVVLLQYPDVQEWLLYISLLYILYYVGLSLYLMSPQAEKRKLGH